MNQEPGALRAEIAAYMDTARNRDAGKRRSGRAAEILDIASDLLRSGGFETFSMRRVAERAHLTLAALQHHFPTRAELVREMIEYRMDWYEGALLARLETVPDDPERALMSLVDWLLDDARFAPSASFTVQFWAFAAYDPDAAAMLDEFMSTYRNFLAFLIQRTNVTLERGEALTRAAAISVMIDGTVVLLAPGKPVHPELRDLHETIRSTALHLVRAPASR
jgi:AcrR family transcriptional regulator